MKRSSDKRLADLEQGLTQRRARERRTHFLWVEPDATDAENEEACQRRIAEGTASAGDRFVLFRWRATDATDSQRNRSLSKLISGE
jgi:hypothetical protein